MPPSSQAEPTQVRPMIAVRLSPRPTFTPPLRRLARRTTTAPGTGSRFAAVPMMLTCTISRAGGWWSAKCAITRYSSELSRVMIGTQTSPATRISSHRIGCSIGGRARNAISVKPTNSASANTSTHGLPFRSRAARMRVRNVRRSSSAPSESASSGPGAPGSGSTKAIGEGYGAVPDPRRIRVTPSADACTRGWALSRTTAALPAAPLNTKSDRPGMWFGAVTISVGGPALVVAHRPDAAPTLGSLDHARVMRVDPRPERAPDQREADTRAAAASSRR